MTAFVKDGELDMDGLVQAVKLATRIGLRQTNVTLDLPEWETVQKRDRLTGVSLSGILDKEHRRLNQNVVLRLKRIINNHYMIRLWKC